MSLTFSTTNYPTGTNPVSVAIGDLNGDGRLDLAAANTGGDPNAFPTPTGPDHDDRAVSRGRPVRCGRTRCGRAHAQGPRASGVD